MSTSLDQNFSDLASILMQRRQMKDKQVQQDRANRLSDLQFKQLQREDDYQTGLRNAMTNPGGSGVTLPQPQPQQNTLASLAPGNQLPFPQPQASFAPVEVKMSPEQAGIEYARKNNRPKDALELIDLNKKMLDHAAQLKVYGGEEQAAQVRAEIEKMTTGTAMFSSWKKAGGLQYAKQMAARFPQVFGGDSMANVNDSNGINEYKLDNGQTVVWSDDNPGQLHLATAPKTESPGKPFSREYDEGDTRVTELYDGSGKLTGTKRAPRYKPAAGGGTPVAQTTFVDPATGNPLTFDKSTGTYRVATVVGGGVAPKPSAMSPEAAGKAQMIEQGITYMPTLRQELFDKDGSVNRTNVANLVTGTPGTRGRELRTLLLDAVEAKLRAESGAAVPEPEVKRAAKRFIPNPMDSANNVKIKLDNLEAYLKGTAAKINTGRGGNKPSGGNGKPIVTKGGFKVTRVP